MSWSYLWHLKALIYIAFERADRLSNELVSLCALAVALIEIFQCDEWRGKVKLQPCLSRIFICKSTSPELVSSVVDLNNSFPGKVYEVVTMTDSLVDALERVQLSSASSDSTADDWIDSILDSPRPRKRKKQSPEGLKLSLEQQYLTPSTSFSSEWLNKLQQCASSFPRLYRSP